jgi:hypothetical protein
LPASGEAFMRVTRLNRAAFAIEHSEGSTGPSSQAQIRGIRVVHEIVTRWAFRLPGWEAGALPPPPPEPTPTRALSITSIIDGHIGPHGNDAILPALRRLERSNDQTPLVGSSDLKVALVFCVPGPLLTFEWHGLRVRGLDRKEHTVEIEVAVPDELRADGVNAFLHETLRQVPTIAEADLHRRLPSVGWATAAVRSAVDLLLAGLTPAPHVGRAP